MAANGSASDFQAALLAAIREAPGMTVTELSLGLGRPHATTSYHLRRLVKSRQAVVVRAGRELRHFPAENGSIRFSYVLALMRAERTRRLLRHLCANVGQPSTVNRIALETGLSAGFVQRTVRQLSNLGLASVDRSSHWQHVQAGTDLVTQMRGLP